MSIERLNAQCVSCLLNKHLKNIPDSFSSAKKLGYMQGILKIIGNADVCMSAPEIVEQIDKFKQSFCENDSFSQIKDFYNNLLLGVEKDIEANIENSHNPLETAVKYAMAGNFIDFGAMESVDEQILKETLQNAEKIVINKAELEGFENEIIKAENIVYLTDNCGEIVLDKLLIKQILKINNSLKINVIVRGEPVLNDCTVDDACQVGLDKLVAVSGNGTAIAGTVLEKISLEAKGLIDNADLVISKGQGNFETLHHCGKNIYYLFLCKCEMFAQRFGVPKFTGVFINDGNLF
ncbi:MAG: DUF89 family protein [Clostridia bacterium]|nr:DUF89 family protein [Clostridia bacterium]